MTENQIMGVSSLAHYQVYFKFKGIAAHAAAAPHQGRSALDAAELMNVGVNYLREHVIPEARLHYAYFDVGGLAPNVVQPTAELLYFIRAPRSSQVEEIFQRVVKVAEGAALMTGTTMEVVWDSACAELLINDTLGKAMYANLAALAPETYTAEELAFAKGFTDGLEETTKKARAARIARTFPGEKPERIAAMAAKPILDDLCPYTMTDAAMPGSTDVGDASWNAPTAQVVTACYPNGTATHSWQWVACGTSSMAHKGMLRAGKVIAMTALDLLENPRLIAEAQEEYHKRLGGEVYHCPIPPKVVPQV
jgi:aminobenzoyl-glutamate utilization protein B